MIALLIAAIGFANLTVDAAQAAAVSRSPDVAAASARIDQSVAALAASRQGTIPQVLSTYAQVPQGNPPGPNVVSRIVTIGLQSTLNDLFAYGATVRAGTLALVGARADYDVAVRTEEIKTVGLYYDALRDLGVARARERALELAQRSLAAARTRFGAGDAPRLDVLRADVASAKATADLEAARATADTSIEALRVETGLPADADLSTTDVTPPTGAIVPRGIGSTVAPTSASTSAPAAPTSAIARADSVPTAPVANDATLDAASVAASALEVRAEVVSADAGVTAALASRSVASAAALPAIVASAGTSSGTDSGVPIGGPVINVSATLPLGGANAARRRQQNAVVAEARAKAAAARRAIRLEVAATARSIGSFERAAAASTRARVGADAELVATELGYRSGASTSFELASARDVDTQARIDEVASAYALAKARATLRLEIGR